MAGKAGMHRKLLNPAAVAVIREKIDAEKIIKKLTNHVLDSDEMSTSQVNAALGLLRKSIPDLNSVELEGSGEHGEHIHIFKWQQ
jgi:hypothetical protein